MRVFRIPRPCVRILVLTALLVNLCYTFHLWVVADVDFIRTHRGLSSFDKIFRRYHPFLGEYVRFLRDSLPPDAVLLLPPGGYPFDMSANTTFFDYFLKPRKILTANRYDRKSPLAAWAVSRGITHIAVCKGTDRYRGARRLGPERNVDANRDYIRWVEAAWLPAVYMPETVTVEARKLELVMADGSSRDVLDRGELVLLKEGVPVKESLVKEMAGRAGERGVRITARYTSRDGAVSPEDFWGVLFGTRVHGVRAVRAELRSTSPASVCLWTEVAGAGEWRLLRSEFNETDGGWQAFEIRAPRATGELTIRSAGLCVRPLGWGYLKVSARAAAVQRER